MLFSIRYTLFFLSCICFIYQEALANLPCDPVINGDFSQATGCPQASFSSDFICRPAAPMVFYGPGNTSTAIGGYAITNNASNNWNSNRWLATDHTGNTNYLIADLPSSSSGGRIWIQNVYVAAGYTYNFTIWARNILKSQYITPGSPTPQVSIQVNGNIIATTTSLPASAANSWTSLSSTYTATVSGTITLSIYLHKIINSNNDVAIDDISFIRTSPLPIISNIVSCSGISATLNASGSPGNYYWYTSPTEVEPVFIGNPFITPVLTTNTNYWVTSSIDCSSPKQLVSILVRNPPSPLASQTFEACLNVPSSLTVSNVSGGNQVLWYTSSTGGTPVYIGNPYTPVLTANTQYWVSQKALYDCAGETEESPRTLFTVNVINCNNTSVYFDGIDDILKIPSRTAYQFGTNNFTLEAIVRVPESSLENSILALLVGDFFWEIGVSSSSTTNIIQMNQAPSYSVSTPISIRNNQCRHIAIRRLGNLLTFFMDGNVIGSTTIPVSNTLNNASPLTVGIDYWNDHPYYLHQLRIWNIARTDVEITTNKLSFVAPSSAGLVGLWEFKEQNSQYVSDFSPINNPIYLGSTPEEGTDDPIRDATLCYTGDRKGELGGVEETMASEKVVLVTPNPSTKEFSITLNSAVFRIDVFNSHCQLVLSQTTTKGFIIFGENLSQGMYLVKVTGENTNSTIKIIKE